MGLEASEEGAVEELSSPYICQHKNGTLTSLFAVSIMNVDNDQLNTLQI